MASEAGSQMSVSQRSVSHSSLYNACKPHIHASNTVQGISRPSRRRPALSYVSGNSKLLRSPGPLESMLKTTTETGDIGLFTIKPSLPPATYHQPPRPRPGIPDVNLLQASRSRFFEDHLFPDDRRLLPSSYRDTTSEILSLYGSEANCSRACTPSNDDGQRSFSLTTCSSRQIPSQKSSGTLQSQGSGPTLQRPRSPFPYPTRLKRPGIRPASPALTDSGAIDYSRMVELDRAPDFRSPLSPYRTSPSYTHRRPPRLSTRAEASCSSTSLPCRKYHSPYYSSPLPHRSRTPSSLHSVATRTFESSYRGFNEPEYRSSSVTSIVDLYRHPGMETANNAPSRNPGSFYYDYSEEFEDDPSPVVVATTPYSPLPQRAPSLHHSFALLTDTAHGSGEALNIEDSVKKIPAAGDDDSPTQLQPRDPSQKGQEHAKAIITTAYGCEEENNYTNVEDGLISMTNNHTAKMMAKSGQPCEPLTEFQSNVRPHRSFPIHHIEIARGDNGLSIPLESVCQPVRTQFGRCMSYSTLQRPMQTMDSTVSRLPTSLSSLSQMAGSKADLETEGTPQLGNNHARLKGTQNIYGACNDTPPCQLHSEAMSGTGASEKPFQKRHRRNPAADRISTSNITGTRILSPEPISPARQLRLKNSVPQLMKALPPLPKEAESTSSQSSAHDSGVGAFGSPDPSLSTAELHKQSQDSERASEEPKTQVIQPKLKLRLKQSFASGTSSNHNSSETCDLEPDLPRECDRATSPAQRRLQLKVSRKNGDMSHARYEGTVLRSPALKQCNSLVDLEHCARKDLFASRCRLEGIFSENGTESSAKLYASKMEKGGGQRLQESPESLDQFDIECPIPVGSPGGTAQAAPNPRKRGLRHSRSLDPNFDSDRDRKVRKKMSFLRFRIPMTPKQADSEAEDTLLQFSIRGVPMLSSARSLDKGKSSIDITQGSAPLSPKAEGRMRRWARSAKRAMRSCVRRTLTSSHG